MVESGRKLEDGYGVQDGEFRERDRDQIQGRWMFESGCAVLAVRWSVEEVKSQESEVRGQRQRRGVTEVVMDSSPQRTAPHLFRVS